MAVAASVRPDDVLRRLVEALKPGGWLVLEELESSSPPSVIAAPSADASSLCEHVLRLVLEAQHAGMRPGWAGHAHHVLLRELGMTGVRTVTHRESCDGGSAGAQLYALDAAQLCGEGPEVWTPEPIGRPLAAGTRRRIQAMCHLGWSLARQAERAAMPVEEYALLLQGDDVAPGIARVVAAGTTRCTPTGPARQASSSSPGSLSTRSP
ncbi:hypothetical protein [Micromonospora aurantiaca (nom. illeg.)]|uniref:hypothetical protein n=1 Tax=Micromonospora aurantiaca (nom. illeg.) TaxID=47850 RepID=UPI0033FE73AB